MRCPEFFHLEAELSWPEDGCLGSPFLVLSKSKRPSAGKHGGGMIVDVIDNANALEPLESRMIAAAHHEAGHIVVGQRAG
jgi:hypothetical protein